MKKKKQKSTIDLGEWVELVMNSMPWKSRKTKEDRKQKDNRPSYKYETKR